jgi:hypothetical protein
MPSRGDEIRYMNNDQLANLFSRVVMDHDIVSDCPGCKAVFQCETCGYSDPTSINSEKCRENIKKFLDHQGVIGERIGYPDHFNPNCHYNENNK